MKNLFLISLFILSIPKLSLGQIEKPITKGNFLTGGSFSFSFEKTKEYGPIVGTNPQMIKISNKKDFESDLYLGYYIFNHFALGLKTDILLTSDKFSYNLDTYIFKHVNHDLRFGPFIRYSTKLGLFFEGAAGIGLLKYDINGDVATWKNYSLKIGIGYSLFISKSVAVEPELKYNYLQESRYEDLESNTISNGLSFAVGFQIYFDTKKNNNQ